MRRLWWFEFVGEFCRRRDVDDFELCHHDGYLNFLVGQ